MTIMLHLKLCGVLLLLLAALHPLFARHFQWQKELAAVSLLTRQVFWVHTLFIGLILAQFGVLSLVFTSALIERTLLARVVLGGLVIFWSARLFAQHFIYSPRLWRGHRLHTAMHILFTGFWAYLAAVYGAALWRQYN
jgi:hypothetical protein